MLTSYHANAKNALAELNKPRYLKLLVRYATDKYNLQLAVPSQKSGKVLPTYVFLFHAPAKSMAIFLWSSCENMNLHRSSKSNQYSETGNELLSHNSSGRTPLFYVFVFLGRTWGAARPRGLDSNVQLLFSAPLSHFERYYNYKTNDRITENIMLWVYQNEIPNFFECS